MEKWMLKLIIVLTLLISPALALITPLPEGHTGIAASYPGDAGIASDPNVIFVDDFESYSSASQLTSKWDSYYQSSNTRIATEPANVFLGSKSLEFTLPASSSEVSNAAVKDISPTQDTLFVRVYTKFDSGYHVTTGSNHNGIVISSQYPGPGSAPNGKDFYLGIVENSIYYHETDPGYTHVYMYHPEQRSGYGDNWFPDGKILPYDSTPHNFGSDFVSRANFIPLRDKWYCYEFMIKANTPGQRDGRVAYWIDGQLKADFTNVRVRDISTLKIDQIKLDFHAQAGGSSRANKKWYDNVVIAKSYIGPMSSVGSCTNECTSGATQCSGTGYQTCGNYDSDSCTEWSTVNACPSGQTCSAGSCVTGTCTPNCAGKVCGDDGCGGSCGPCQTGYTCSAGQCVAGTCTPDWQCTSWSSCTSNQQTRTCSDQNRCGSTVGKPAELQSCTSGNLANNGDFEGGFTNGVANGWTISSDSNIKYTASQDSGHSGSAQKIQVTAKGSWGLNLYQMPQLVVGKQYDLTFWYKSEMPVNAEVIDGQGSIAIVRQALAPSSDWKQMNIRFNYTNSAANQLRFLTSSVGSVWIDDVGLFEVTCTPADSDCDGCIRQDELLAYIAKWKDGQVTLVQLIEAIALWKNGC